MSTFQLTDDEASDIRFSIGYSEIVLDSSAPLPKGMSKVYGRDTGHGVADLFVYKAFVENRAVGTAVGYVHVPLESRGGGHAKAAIEALCRDADHSGETLLVSVEPSKDYEGRRLVRLFGAFDFVLARMFMGTITLYRSPKV